jgi:hypothetical protein
MPASRVAVAQTPTTPKHVLRFISWSLTLNAQLPPLSSRASRETLNPSLLTSGTTIVRVVSTSAFVVADFA